MNISLPPPTGQPRCPSCGALTPAGASGRAAQWCSLCHSPLHGGEGQSSTREPPAVVVVEPAQPGELVGGHVDDGLVEQMLVDLRAADVDPWVRRSSQMTRGRQVALGAAVALGIIVLILVITAVVGILLR